MAALATRGRTPYVSGLMQTALMAEPRALPVDLSPDQVIALQDALLANANRLLAAALVMLDAGDVALARSLAILGMEESGKAIAIHQRRVGMAYADEGEPFVDERLRKLWGNHGTKLSLVHDFLVGEEYWFGVEPADPEENARALGEITAWRDNHNLFKQRGFYVDVTKSGDPVSPSDGVDPEAVAEAIGYVHQIGWQLRLGEHIEGKRRREQEADVPPASEEEIEDMRRAFHTLEPEFMDDFVGSMREGSPGKKFNNADYAFRQPAHPFANVGKTGYEAEDRELFALMQPTEQGDTKHDDTEQPSER